MRHARDQESNSSGPQWPQQKTGQAMSNTAAWGGKDKAPFPPATSGHLPARLPQFHSGASVRRALLPIALMSKKNLFSRLALQLLPEDVASCLALRKVVATRRLQSTKYFSFGSVVPGSLFTWPLVVPPGGGFTSLVGSFLVAFLLLFRFGGRPAGSLSKNTSKRLDVHAGNWLGVRSLQAPTIAIPYVRGQVGYSP